MIVIAILIIAGISIAMSVWSLKTMQKGLKTKETQDALKKGRVIFHSSDVVSSSES